MQRFVNILNDMIKKAVSKTSKLSIFRQAQNDNNLIINMSH